MSEKEIILDAMKKAGEPLNAGKIAELTGLDRKVVDKTMTAMKKEGSIVSPIRCKWEPAEKCTHKLFFGRVMSKDVALFSYPERGVNRCTLFLIIS